MAVSGPSRATDGSAGDADYGVLGAGYSDHRRPEPRIAERIAGALGESRTVVNVGAGAGSYELTTLKVTAVEPSEPMRAQRPAHLPPAIDAVAERLPFEDDAFDAAMTTFSVHQWSDLRSGLREMRRVARGPVVILTCDPDLVRDFWLYEYAPLVLDAEARRYPSVTDITEALGGHATVGACSAWSFVEPAVRERYADHLRRDLASGAWDARHGASRTQPYLNGSLVLIRAVP